MTLALAQAGYRIQRDSARHRNNILLKEGTLFPDYLKPVSRLFRERRNRRLSAMIDQLQIIKGTAVEVLDIGSSVVFWLSVADYARAKCKISLINLSGAYDGLPPEEERLKRTFTLLTGGCA